jgi:hypothetical protein
MFGVSKGRISISVRKTSYAPGDIVSGNVVLTLKAPVKAREVSISLIGEQWVVSRYEESSRGISLEGIGRAKSTSTSKQKKRIYDFKQLLDGEKEYADEREYRFEIKIPADMPHMPGREGEARRASKIGQAVAAMTSLTRPSPIKWYLLAKLDIPRGLDISKKVEITIG